MFGDDRCNVGVRRRWWRRGGGRLGMVIISLLTVVAFFAPVLANDQPLVCRFEGRWHLPAVVDLVHQVPGAWRWVEKSGPFHLAGFDAKAALKGSAEAYWPPIAFGPIETSADSFSRPSREHWLGTDEVGRDVAARLVYGAAVALKVGLVSMGIAGLIGIVVGGVAGYAGGWVDALLSRVIEMVMCFPVIFLILAIMVWLPPSIVNVMVVIGLTRWTPIARYVRAEILRLKVQDFVMAARSSGAGPLRIMLRHLLPNAMGPIWVTLSFGMAQAILIEAALSWLGFGVEWPDPSWGTMLRSAFDELRVAPHLMYPPCIAIFLAVFSYNLVGDALRDAFDARLGEN